MTQRIREQSAGDTVIDSSRDCQVTDDPDKRWHGDRLRDSLSNVASSRICEQRRAALAFAAFASNDVVVAIAMTAGGCPGPSVIRRLR